MWQWLFPMSHDLSHVNRRLDGICEKIDLFEQLLRAFMSQLDDQIQALTDAVAQETTVNASAITLINGIPGLIADAIAKATAAGATPAQLQALSDLQAKVTSSSTDLAAAVMANTPAAPPATT